MTDGSAALGVCGKHLEAELDTLHAWYVAFGDALVRQGAVTPPHLRDRDGRRALLDCATAAARGDDNAAKHAALILLLAAQHLDNVRRLEAHLGERANAARATGSGQTAARRSHVDGDRLADSCGSGCSGSLKEQVEVSCEGA